MPYQTPSASQYVQMKRIYNGLLIKQYESIDKNNVVTATRGGYSAGMPNIIRLPCNYLQSNKFPAPDCRGGSPLQYNPFPITNFLATPDYGVEDLTVVFTDLTANDPNSWLWDFGDGATSTDQNPIYTYVDPGLYTVTLTSTNDAGSATMIKTNYITVTPLPPPPTPAPLAVFTATPLVLLIGESVEFTDSSLNTPTSWLWDFGDGTTSTDQNPTHTYTTSGIYDVSLTATNEYGDNTITKTNYITVNIPIPVASFNADTISGLRPLVINFTDTSTNIPTSWLWNFGDGTTSTQQNPTKTYSTAGTYTVILTVTNGGGSNALTRTNYITVSLPPTPVAEFTSDKTSGVRPLTVVFTDTSTNTPTSWLWNFGDGTTSTQQSPTKTYSNAGTYTVTLTATNDGGSNTNTKTNYITATLPGPVANFGPDSPQPVIVGNSFSFIDTSANTPTSWLWDFGDGTTSTSQNPTHTYSVDGVYTVSLTATNSIGSDTVSKTNYIMVAPIRIWYGASIAKTGRVMMAGQLNGKVYISIDYGASWYSHLSNSQWICVSVLRDQINNVIVVACEDGGKVYEGNINLFGDATWTYLDNFVGNWRSYATSSTGRFHYLVADNSQIYVCDNSSFPDSFSYVTAGSWVTKGPLRNWTGVDCSENGFFAVACANNSYIYTTTDSGVTWTQRAMSKSWYGVACSADGRYIVASVAGDKLYVSNDYGVSWTARASVQGWRGVTCSDSGMYMFAVSNGYIYYSTNYGVTWTQTASSQYWFAIDCSASGQYLVATPIGNYIYKSNDYGLTWTSSLV